MKLIDRLLWGANTFPRGVHPPGCKQFSAGAPVEVLPTPEQLNIPLLQHAGAPCEPTVAPRQEVAYEALIGKAVSMVSAPLHSPASGRVLRMGVATLPNGRHVKSVTIAPDGAQPTADQLMAQLFGGEWPVKGLRDLASRDLDQLILDAGIVGLGGAAFPTHVKLTPDDRKPIDTYLVNGCECEPYLTTDDALMKHFPGPVVTGALLARQSVGAKRLLICIEDNKPDAIRRMRAAVQNTEAEIVVVKTKYPQGSERHLIKAVVGRVVPLGKLPADVGVMVSNVATLAAVAAAVLRCKKLTHRIVSVTGGGVRQPKNIIAPIGAPLGALIDFCGGLTPDAARIIAGGPMMGFAFGDLESPVTKGTGGLTVLTAEDVRRQDATRCIRCGRCADVCPMKLVPAKLAQASLHRNIDLAEKYHIMACMETGCCGYICPSGIPLVQLIRTGKALAVARQKERSERRKRG